MNTCTICKGDLYGRKGQLDNTCKKCRAYIIKKEEEPEGCWDNKLYNWYEFYLDYYEDHYDLTDKIDKYFNSIPGILHGYYPRLEYVRKYHYNFSDNKYNKYIISCKNNGKKKFIRLSFKLGDFIKKTIEFHNNEIIYSFKVYNYEYKEEYDADFFFPDGFYFDRNERYVDKAKISSLYNDLKSICEEFVSTKYIPEVKRRK